MALVFSHRPRRFVVRTFGGASSLKARLTLAFQLRRWPVHWRVLPLVPSSRPILPLAGAPRRLSTRLQFDMFAAARRETGLQKRRRHPASKTQTNTEVQCTEPRRVHLRSSQPFPGANIFCVLWGPVGGSACGVLAWKWPCVPSGGLGGGPTSSTMAGSTRSPTLLRIVQWARESGASAAEVGVWAQGLRHLTQAAELRAKAAQRGFAKRSREELAYFLSERRKDSQATGRSSGSTGPEGEARGRPRGVLPRESRQGQAGAGEGSGQACGPAGFP